MKFISQSLKIIKELFLVKFYRSGSWKLIGQFCCDITGCTHMQDSGRRNWLGQVSFIVSVKLCPSIFLIYCVLAVYKLLIWC